MLSSKGKDPGRFKAADGKKGSKNLLPNTKAGTDRYSSPEMSNKTQKRSSGIRLGIDLGTSTLGLAYQLEASDSRTDVFTILSEETLPCTPMVVAYSDNKFVWGHSALYRFRNGYEDNILRLFKLALYPDPSTDDLRKEVEERLESVGKTIQELITDCIKAIVQYALSKIEQTALSLGYNLDISCCDLFISVPVIWRPDGCYIMAHAAESTGARSCQLVSEPECAASYLLQKRMTTSGARVADYLTEGDVVLVADIGGGTGDFVSYRLLGPPQDQEHVCLMEVSKPAGFLCGSEFVNREFLTWLKTEKRRSGHGALQRAAESTGRSVDSYLMAASLAFDEKKPTFPGLTKYTIVVERTGTGHSEAIEFSKARMEACFRRVMDDAIEAIEAQVNPDTTAIMVSGGFSRCKPFIDELRSIFERREDTLYTTTSASSKRMISQSRKVPPQPIRVLDFPDGAQNPVAEGALHRYQDVKICGVRSRYHIGISRVEEYNRNIHTDALPIPPSAKTKREKEVYLHNKWNYIKPDPIDSNLQIVEDRWVPLLKKGEITDGGIVDQASDTWESRYPLAGQVVEFAQKIYFTDMDISPHEPVMNKDGSLREGISLLTTIHKSFDPKEYDVDWTVIQADDGSDVHQVWCRMVIRTDGLNTKFGWQIVTDSSNPYFVNGMENPNVSSLIAWDDAEMIPLLNEKFSFEIRK